MPPGETRVVPPEHADAQQLHGHAGEAVGGGSHLARVGRVEVDESRNASGSGQQAPRLQRLDGNAAEARLGAPASIRRLGSPNQFAKKPCECANHAKLLQEAQVPSLWRTFIVLCPAKAAKDKALYNDSVGINSWPAPDFTHSLVFRQKCKAQLGFVGTLYKKTNLRVSN